MRCPIHKKTELIAQDLTRQGFPYGYCERCQTRWYRIGNKWLTENEYMQSLAQIEMIQRIGNPSIRKRDNS